MSREASRRQEMPNIAVASCPRCQPYLVPHAACLYPGTEEGGIDPMTGHRPFKELTKGFSAARKARVAARVSKLKTEMALHELRQARERSQEDPAPE